MKRHIQSGYAEIQLIPAAKALKPHKALQEWRLGFEVMMRLKSGKGCYVESA